jgi:hypothetical protein
MMAVEILRGNHTLHLENQEKMSSKELLELVGDFYQISPQEYCSQMLDPKTWGGGPEIVALCNHFQCPIHVYQLRSQGCFFPLRKTFSLELCAKFGAPSFSSKNPLHILSVDGRFPNIKPGQQKQPGDHFMALFPEKKETSGNDINFHHFFPELVEVFSSQEKSHNV